MIGKRFHTSLLMMGVALFSVLLACGADDEDSKGAKEYTAPPAMTIDPNTNYTATIEMEKGGKIAIGLFPKEAPKTVNNFVFLAREGFYDGVTFHRVIADFMAQGGDPSGSGRGGPGYTFENEFSPLRRHDGPGVVSMANKGLSGGQATNGSQFFITFVATGHLDGLNPDGSTKDCENSSCHSVFGEVTGGMDVVNSIAQGDVIKRITIKES